MAKTVLSFSGGLDSSVLLYHLKSLGDEVFCLNFHYGAKHNDSERARAQALCAQAGAAFIPIDLPFIDSLLKSDLLKSGGPIPQGHYTASSMRQTVVPGRNTVLMSLAIAYAESIEADRIAIANHADDHATYPDTRPEWVAAMSLVAYHGTYQRLGFFAPFTYLRKAEICERGAELAVPFAQTWTCYEGGEKHCGLCGSCSARKEAFTLARVLDPTDYAV